MNHCYEQEPSTKCRNTVSKYKPVSWDILSLRQAQRSPPANKESRLIKLQQEPFVSYIPAFCFPWVGCTELKEAEGKNTMTVLLSQTFAFLSSLQGKNITYNYYYYYYYIHFFPVPEAQSFILELIQILTGLELKPTSNICILLSFRVWPQDVTETIYQNIWSVKEANVSPLVTWACSSISKDWLLPYREEENI